MAHIYDLILPIILSLLIFGIGKIGLLIFKSRLNYSRFITLMLVSYGLMISEIFIIIYSLFHIHSFYKFHLHLSRFNEHDFFSVSNPIDIPSILFLSIIFTFVIFLISFLLSQISLQFLLTKLEKKSNPRLSSEIKYNWLPNDYNLLVYDNHVQEAFTFTLLRRDKLKIYAENWIILSSEMIDLLDADELEMVVAHEYSHTYENDTRYSHLIYTISSIIFFDPTLKLIKYIMHENHEKSADFHAVELIGKPRALARALYKTIEPQKRLKSITSTGIVSKNKNLVIRRINNLLDYADQHNINI